MHLYRKNVAFIQQHTGIYTTTHWHLYNNTLPFIQKHTSIYTKTHFHLYNNTLAFIQQHTGIYTTTHWHLYKTHFHLYNNTLAFIQQHTCIYTNHVILPFSPKLFMALCHEWHADKLNACRPWQSAAQFFFFLPKLFMALCHEWHVQSKCMPSMAECCPIFVFPSQTLHGTLP